MLTYALLDEGIDLLIEVSHGLVIGCLVGVLQDGLGLGRDLGLVRDLDLELLGPPPEASAVLIVGRGKLRLLLLDCLFLSLGLAPGAALVARDIFRVLS